MNRRTLLLQLLGLAAGGAGASATASLAVAAGRAAGRGGAMPFRPLLGPIPLPSDGLSARQQRQHYRRIDLADRLLLANGYRSDLLFSWGDPLGTGRFGFNNDYLAFQATGPDRGLLTVNFEYISTRPWVAGYAEAIGAELPFERLETLLAARGGRVNALALTADDPLRAPLLAVARAALEDVGIGVTAIERDADGRWRLQPGHHDRRITGLSGWRDPARRLRCSGPAAAVFRRRERLGYDDGLGDSVIGTFANCAGGQTPWGTVLSAEENIQVQVVEAVHADGSSPDPGQRPFRFDGRRLEGLGNPFGLAGNKYGWMVELDPRQPEQAAVKHTALGRFRHEAVAVRARAGEPLVVYSGCDRHGGHLYRFVSQGRILSPDDTANSELLEQGRLEAAVLQPDGSGRWLPLDPQTPLRPVPPSHFSRRGVPQATLLPHSDRTRAGAEAFNDDASVDAYRRRYPRLADLYPGSGDEQRGAILIDAHLAANAVGATPAARPEDTELDPRNGDLLIAFTAGGSDDEGRADPAIFHGPNGEPEWPHGWLMRLQENPDGTTFRWRMVATGGTPWQGGMGFSHPDNLAFDRAGNLWMVTDRPSGGSGVDVFGNNACWLLPASGPAAGQALLFASGPMECELCGPCFDQQERTLFLAVQHPGEDGGSHQRGQEEFQAFSLRDRNGVAFDQLRRVPLGSNWPSGVPGRAPRPGVVAIRRSDGAALLSAAGPAAVKTFRSP